MQDRPDAPKENRGAVGKLVPASQAGVPATREPYAALGGYPGIPGDAPGDFRVDLLAYWRVVKKRKWLILSILGTFVVFGALRTLMETPLYTAGLRLQIDRSVAKVIEGGNVAPMEGAYDFDFLRTQYELLKSRAMAERVASELRLADDADFFKPRQASIRSVLRGMISAGAVPENKAPNKAALQSAAAGMIAGNIAVRPVTGSRLVDISYSDPDPARAQRIVTAFANAFIASNLDKRFEANAYAKTFLEDRLKELKLRLEDSGSALMNFAEKEQIIAATEKSSIAENNLASANAALSALISERIKNEQLWRQVQSTNAINMPQLLDNTVISGLRTKRNLLVTEYQEKLETYKADYPAMVQLKNKIAEIDRQLATEVQTIKSSLKAAYENSRNQEAELQKQVETLKAEVLDLQKRSIHYNILKREVDTNRTLYEGLLQRFKEIDVASGVGANNVFIVERAEVPGFPSSPQMSRALTFSFALGLGAGLAAAYVLEILDDTIKSPEEGEQATGLTTLGVIPNVKAGQTIEDELGDLRSAASEAYRSLCTSLQFSTDSGLPKTLFITSAGPSEGKSITALAIARHFAMMGLKVLVVDGDLRNPSLHSKLGLDNGIGFSNYLTGHCTPPETFQKTGIPNLAMMASGPLPPNAADLLASARVFSLLSVGLEVFDFIVIDGPPVMGLADAPLLSSATAATVFVIGAGQARAGQVTAALKRLHHARGTVLGTVLTKFDVKNSAYGYGYGYGYGNSAALSGPKDQLMGPHGAG